VLPFFAINKAGAALALAALALFWVLIPYRLLRQDRAILAAWCFVCGGLLVFSTVAVLGSPLSAAYMCAGQLSLTIVAAVLLGRKAAYFLAAFVFTLDLAIAVARAVGVSLPILFPGTPVVGTLTAGLLLLATVPLISEAATQLRRSLKRTEKQLLHEKEARELLALKAKELLESEERFLKAFYSNPDGLAITTAAGDNFVEVNDAFLATLEYARPELVGRSSSDLNLWFDPQQRDQVVQKIERGEPIREYETRLQTRSGKERHLLLSAERVQIQGEPCILWITRDVTEQRLLEQQFHQAQKLEAVGRLAGGVAHDFNNLLGVIIGYSDLLSQEAAPPISKKLQSIKGAANRASLLTAQLLAFSRKQVLRPSLLDVNAAVTDTHKILAHLIGEDIRLNMRLGGDLGLVRADRGQIGQILMNLAVNARDAMPRGGQLTIETASLAFETPAEDHNLTIPPGRYVMLAVSDTGLGMDQETLAHIFEPFFTTKPVGKGTGLGLSTVQGIVQQNGGLISVSSEPGKGTTFRIYLPQAVLAEKAEPRAEEEAQVPRGSETILLVEDAASLRDLIAEGLHDCGYQVLVAADSAEALRVAEQHSGPIHLLLTDVVLPGIRGPELAQRVTALRPDTKVFYMSGYTDEELSPRSALGSEAFIEKPFPLAELTQRIHKILASTRKQPESWTNVPPRQAASEGMH
jgi:PAS domain S-box-containing protein